MPVDARVEPVVGALLEGGAESHALYVALPVAFPLSETVAVLEGDPSLVSVGGDE